MSAWARTAIAAGQLERLLSVYNLNKLIKVNLGNESPGEFHVEPICSKWN
jgi:hypothetical protein